MALPSHDHFWKQKGFKPNDSQHEAIPYTGVPLFLTAGSGSGKTRGFLWHSLNLIVFENVDPKKIFLSTFTEKAAHQLKEGLRSLLGLVTNQTGVPYKISGMADSRHLTVTNVIKLFTRFSEENLKLGEVNPILANLLKMYSFYRESHKKDKRIETVGFSLLIGAGSLKQSSKCQ